MGMYNVCIMCAIVESRLLHVYDYICVRQSHLRKEAHAIYNNSCNF